jgi:hypothetical protein
MYIKLQGCKILFDVNTSRLGKSLFISLSIFSHFLLPKKLRPLPEVESGFAVSLFYQTILALVDHYYRQSRNQN